MKPDGKQNSWLANILDYIGKRKEMEDNKPVSIGLPIGQNGPSVPIGSQTQLNNPIGDNQDI